MLLIRMMMNVKGICTRHSPCDPKVMTRTKATMTAMATMKTTKRMTLMRCKMM